MHPSLRVLNATLAILILLASTPAAAQCAHSFAIGRAAVITRPGCYTLAGPISHPAPGGVPCGTVLADARPISYSRGRGRLTREARCPTPWTA